MSKENFRSSYGLLNTRYSSIPTVTVPDTLGNMSFGTGGLANIRQDIGHSIRHGFGRNTGSFYPRSVRRRFNREFQRCNYNAKKFGNPKYAYECKLPSSYYPSRHNTWFPYSFNYDPYPYHELDQQDFCEPQQEIQNTTDDQPAKCTTIEHDDEQKYNFTPMMLLLLIIVVASFIIGQAAM